MPPPFPQPFFPPQILLCLTLLMDFRALYKCKQKVKCAKETFSPFIDDDDDEFVSVTRKEVLYSTLIGCLYCIGYVTTISFPHAGLYRASCHGVVLLPVLIE
ncbi:hypothetical protein FKM82_004655 [Ascaphus truei]